MLLEGAGVKHSIGLTLMLSVFWLAWSGHFEPLILGLGAASLLFVVALSARLKVVDEESVPLGLHYPRLLLYVPWLAFEIVKANLDVARRILTPGRLPIAPRLIRVPASQRTELAQVIYANSITLTPGTISLDLKDGQILVHALHAEAAAGVEAGDMDRKCAQLEAGLP
jgi:multicomponent Na+:H+ antiporter subunit E